MTEHAQRRLDRSLENSLERLLTTKTCTNNIITNKKDGCTTAVSGINIYSSHILIFMVATATLLFLRPVYC